MKLGVVIVTYNRLELLKECIEACLNQKYKFSEILIVNNNSTDNTSDYLESLNYENLTIINLQENIGGAGGFYVGVEKLSQKDLDYILLIDDDAILDNEYNSNIVENIVKDNGKICAYSGTVKTDNMIQYEHRRHLLNGFKCVNSRPEEYDKEYFDYELSTFCGLYISNKIIKEIGLPNREFFIWFDDTEYSLRLRKYGKIRNINNAYLNHKTVISLNTGYNWKSYYGLRNQIVIIKKNFSKYTLLRFIMSMCKFIIGGRIMRVLKNDPYYSEISDIYRDALKDGIKERMGKNDKYIPGMKLEKKR